MNDIFAFNDVENDFLTLSLDFNEYILNDSRDNSISEVKPIIKVHQKLNYLCDENKVICVLDDTTAEKLNEYINFWNSHLEKYSKIKEKNWFQKILYKFVYLK